MKISKVIAVALVVITQIFLFAFIWNWLVAVAADSGRGQRGGVGFGITIYYGAIMLAFIFLIASVVSAIARRRKTRWLTIVGLLAVWSTWIFPSLSSYPVRGPVHLSLGALILITGSGILLPILIRAIERLIGGSGRGKAERPPTAT